MQMSLNCANSGKIMKCHASNTALAQNSKQGFQLPPSKKQAA